MTVQDSLGRSPEVLGDGTDEDVRQIIDITYERDTDAFVASDWAAVADDFDAEAFTAYRGAADDGPWQLEFASLDPYRDLWIEQSRDLTANIDPSVLAAQLRAASRIARVEVRLGRAIVRKLFDGEAGAGDRRSHLEWLTYYFLKKRDGRWRITGFVGYLPNPETA